MPLHHLTRFPRTELIGAPTPLEYLPRLSDYLGREIYIKRDDVTPIAMGGNKLRKLEFLVADALRGGYADNRKGDSVEPCPSDGGGRGQIGAALRRFAGKSIGTTAENYLTNGNRLLLDLFNTQIEMCDALTDPDAQLQTLATRIEAQGFRPYVIPVGGSSALGAMGYVESATEIAQQCEEVVGLSSVVVASGSAGTHAGLAVGLEHLMPDVELIGVTVSRSVAEQKPKVIALQQAIAGQLALTATADIHLWDDYFTPGYGVPNDAGMEAVKLLASPEGVLLDPVYTGKAMAGLIDGISQKRFNDDGPILFIHTGGAPALFAYHPHV
ncbi:D-cysteine desulfhydrase [Salmonella enterica subsp. enterica serovar Worthington]|nr:D-cysteine desulfhydrase [Salmonella enterica subsp. enterica serovar Worthington]